MMTHTTLVGNLLAFAALLVFSINIVVTRIAASLLNLGIGFLIAVTVNVLLAALLLMIQVGAGGEWPVWNGRAFIDFLCAGVFATFLGRWLFFESIAFLGAARASAFQVSSPVFVALLGAFFLEESVSLLGMTGIMVTVGGLVLLSVGERKPGFLRSGSTLPAISTAAPVRWSRVMLFGFGASLAYAVGNLFRGAAIHSWNEPVLGSLIGALSGLALHLAFSNETRLLKGRVLQREEKRGAWCYLVSGVLTIVGQILMIAAMARIPVANASVITLCSPLLVLPMSHFWLNKHDAVSLLTWVGAIMTVLGVAVVVTH